MYLHYHQAMVRKKPQVQTTLSGVSANQVLKLKRIALSIVGKSSVSALVRAIADGTVKVVKREKEKQ